MGTNFDDGPQVWGPKSGGTPVPTFSPEADRILGGGAVFGKGTGNVLYSAGTAWIYERAEERNVVSVSQDLKDGFPFPTSGRGPIPKNAWNDFKGVIDDVRSAEGADVFNWVNAIDANFPTLKYRNEIAAAWEFWSAASQSRVLQKAATDEATWNDATAACEDATFTKGAEGELNVHVLLQGVHDGSDYDCLLQRTSIRVPLDTDLLPTTPSKYIMAMRIGSLWDDDWGRNNGLKLWTATGSDWDDRDTLLYSYSEAQIVDAINNHDRWLWMGDVTSDVAASQGGTDNYFMLALDHDDTTEDGSGTFSHPIAPANETRREGMEGAALGDIVYIHAYVDDVADI